MDLKIDLEFAPDELVTSVRVEALIALAEHMGAMREGTTRETILTLFAAGTILLIREPPPDGDIVKEIRKLTQEALEYARLGKWPSSFPKIKGWNTVDDGPG